MFTHLEAVRLMPVLKRRYPGSRRTCAICASACSPATVRARRTAPRRRSSSWRSAAIRNTSRGTARGASRSRLRRGFRHGRRDRVRHAHVTAALCDRIADGDLIPDLRPRELPRGGSDDVVPARGGGGVRRRSGQRRQAPTPPRLVPDRDPTGERSDETAPAVRSTRRSCARFEQNPHLKILRAEGPIDLDRPLRRRHHGRRWRARHAGARRLGTAGQRLALSRHGHETRGVFLHDEWDHPIADYRARWCPRARDRLDGDNGEFFTGTLLRYAEVLPEVRRQFLRVKPEGYCTIHGLLDGEDFDLNAAVDARSTCAPARHPTASTTWRGSARSATSRRSSCSTCRPRPTRTPSPRRRCSRTPSASTRRIPEAAPRRIIDIQKEALVIIVAGARGDRRHVRDLRLLRARRDRVEFFDVKAFDELLNLAVRGRIGAIEPQRSTRMGGAAAVGQQAAPRRVAREAPDPAVGRLPQDFDYGEDRRSNVYGLRDTMMALREAQRAGIAPFCITVDRAGNDYLREMIDEKRYLVIEDISELPRQLPKIYSEATRGG